ncbi:MAG: biotin carboxylase N-terminal domain-containing protein [Gemmataceae bacterium]
MAVFSEADHDARHVELADEAVAIGPPAARESYLVIDKILAACKQTGAEPFTLATVSSRKGGILAHAGGERCRLHRPQALLDRRDGRQDRLQAAGEEAESNTSTSCNDPIDTPSRRSRSPAASATR